MLAKKLIKECESAAQLLKQLAHPRRLQILCYLADGEKTVGELEKLSGISQSLVSQFLGKMKSEGLVSCQKVGQFAFYRILDPKINQIIQSLQKIFTN